MDELDPGTNSLIRCDIAADGAGAVVVTIEGELDISGVDALERQVAPVLATEPARLVVDVAGLRFADSSAIALWVRWAATARGFELRDPSSLLRRVIVAMGLGEKLGVKP